MRFRALWWFSALGFGFVPQVFGAAAKPSPEVVFSASVQSTRGSIAIRNASSQSVKILADIRFLSVHFVPPESSSVRKSKAKTIDCTLPNAMHTDTDRWLVLAPSQSYQDSFDIDLFCLGRRAPDSYVAEIKWGSTTQSVALPTVASYDAVHSMTAVVGDVSSVFSAPSASTSTSGSTSSSASSAIVSSPVAELLSGPPMSFARELDITNVSVTFVNHGPPADVFANPGAMTARVLQPNGALVTCNRFALAPAPIADFVSHLRTGEHVSVSVPLLERCPRGTFASPGIYRLNTSLTTPAFSWRVKRALTGVYSSSEPLFLRIESGDVAFYASAPSAVPTTSASTSASRPSK